jgi:hypothetical protein
MKKLWSSNQSFNQTKYKCTFLYEQDKYKQIFIMSKTKINIFYIFFQFFQLINDHLTLKR